MSLTSTDDLLAPFDPFELRDVMGGNVTDPFPRLAELRRQSPVHLGPVDLGAGCAEALPGPLPATVLGFDEVMGVFRDRETFSSSVYEGVIGAVMGRTILEMDEPEHRVHRALVSPVFRSKVLERWEEDLVGVVVNELIDGFAGRGRADLVRELTFNFPVQVIARILGLPRADYRQFQQWAIAMTSVAADWPRAVAASAALRDYFAAVLAERRACPEDDLISELAVVEVEGRRLCDEEIFSFLRLLLPAGVETTYRGSGTCLYALLRHPEQLAAVVADPGLVVPAFEEALRWEPPVTVVLRRARHDTEIGGVEVAGGADIALMIGAANRDERRFVGPDAFDIFREGPSHVGFGFGVHVCLGMHLARMEARVALQAVIARLPDLRLDPSGPDPSIRGLAFRSPDALPVRFSAT